MNTIIDYFPKRINTKIVGATFEGRQKWLYLCKVQGVREVKLIAEPDNPYDSNAIAVTANLNIGGVFHEGKLGYISNSERACLNCGNVLGNKYFSDDETPACPNCNSNEFARAGLATEVTRAINAGAEYGCLIASFTGGDMDNYGSMRNLGCNIQLKLIHEPATNNNNNNRRQGYGYNT